MMILAFDTATAACSVALWRDGSIVTAARETMAQGQAEALIPMIEHVLAAAGCAYADLDRVAVTVGPGSFTGARVGLAAARGIGLAIDRPVIGVTTLEVLAAAARGGDTKILAAIDTKRGDVYVQAFARDGQPSGPPAALAPEAVSAWLGEGPVLVVGDGTAQVMAVLGDRATASQADPFPAPAIIAALAAQRQPEPLGPQPLYVLPPQVTLPGGQKA